MAIQIMAIINVSPDSFSGDGIEQGDTAVLRQRLRLAIEEGADILDIGGQSTRPGAEVINAQTEIARVLPAITIARELSASIPISIDTFKPEVAEAAFAAGATMLNDVRGLRDEALTKFAATQGCPVVIMHMRGTPKTMSALTDYPSGVLNETLAFFRQHTAQLTTKGIAAENIIIDPGIGFAKTAAQSFLLTKHLQRFTELGFPVLYGASNKSFIGKALEMAQGAPLPVEERAAGTVVVQAYAMLQGASIIRVHDVKHAVQTRTIVEALSGGME